MELDAPAGRQGFCAEGVVPKADPSSGGHPPLAEIPPAPTTYKVKVNQSVSQSKKSTYLLFTDNSRCTFTLYVAH